MAVAEDFGTVRVPDSAAGIRRILWSSVIGTAVEWYDFLIYGAATALVFNKIFFAAGDPALATIAAFGTYAVGFLARPLGAAIFGHYGDRVGRKAMLAITIIVMGVGTFLIGLLPTYQQIGVAAPVLLVALRFLQGIGLGGEWGGAVLMVVENAPTHRRGLFGSMVQIGNPVGNIAAIGVFALVSQLPESEFMAWGWRVPFLISILLVGVGLWIRLSMEETPAFPVHTVDTLGAGDVFHGAFALALTEKQDLREALRFASAAAALKCTRFGGAFAAPQRAEVEALLGQSQGARPAQTSQ